MWRIVSLIAAIVVAGSIVAPAGADTVLASACPSAAVFEDVFFDVRDGSTHDFAIDCLSWWRVTSGSGLGNDTPAAAVTRGQMAAMLATALERGGIELPAPNVDAFSDIADSAHAEDINTLAAAGIVLGRVDGAYGPNEHVSRAQTASYLAAALSFASGIPLRAGDDAFDDDDGSIHEHNIDAVAAAGLASGFADGTFRPALAVRRDQIASLVARLLDALVVDGHATVPPGPVLGADDTIRWDGVGPVRVGMTVAQARRAAGVTTTLTNDFGSACEFLEFDDPALRKRFGVMVIDGTVARVANYGAFHGEQPAATPEGVGISSTVAQVTAAFGAGHLTQRPHPYTDGRYLVVMPADPASPLLTIFETGASGLVTSYRRGFAEEVELIEGCA